MGQLISLVGDEISLNGLYIDCDGELKFIKMCKYNPIEVLFNITDDNYNLLWKGKYTGEVNKILAEVLIDKYERVERGLC